MEAAFHGVGISCPVTSASLSPASSPPFLLLAPRRFLRKPTSVASAARSSLTGAETAEQDAMQLFLKERYLEGDFISKLSDALWRKEGRTLHYLKDSNLPEDLPNVEVGDDQSNGGFLRLTETREWLDGGSIAPINKKVSSKEQKNDSEKWKKLNFLRYEALKRELLVLTTGIGIACSGYCLLTFSIQASLSYATGVVLSCLYLQLLYYHADNLSKERVPQIFLQKKAKKIGIRSDDLKDFFEKIVKGSAIALSSPRLVFPAVVYGIWALSNHYFNEFFDFQLVPAMFGLFAYKAAALVQVYRDNEDLRLIFPDEDDVSTGY